MRLPPKYVVTLRGDTAAAEKGLDGHASDDLGYLLSRLARGLTVADSALAHFGIVVETIDALPA